MQRHFLVLSLKGDGMNTQTLSPTSSSSSSPCLPKSGIYVGTVRHRRFTPVTHAFEYPMFMPFDFNIPPVCDDVEAIGCGRWNPACLFPILSATLVTVKRKSQLTVRSRRPSLLLPMPFWSLSYSNL